MPNVVGHCQGECPKNYENRNNEEDLKKIAPSWSTVTGDNKILPVCTPTIYWKFLGRDGKALHVSVCKQVWQCLTLWEGPTIPQSLATLTAVNILSPFRENNCLQNRNRNSHHLFTEILHVWTFRNLSKLFNSYTASAFFFFLFSLAIRVGPTGFRTYAYQQQTEPRGWQIAVYLIIQYVKVHK